MTSQFQKIPFDPTILGRIQSIKVLTNDNQTVEIDYQDLKLINWKPNPTTSGSGSLAFEYKSEDGDLYMPLCRIDTTLKKIIGE